MSEVKVIEVSPRDGLQNESQFIKTEEKIRLINNLIKSGIEHIELTSFVNPKKVPQMADAEKLSDYFKEEKALAKTALIPNIVGYERARDRSIDEVNWISAATDRFNQKNIGMSIKRNDELLKQVIREAQKDGINLCYSVAVAFGCPYEGVVDHKRVLERVDFASRLGVDRITIADTIGYAIPKEVHALMTKVLHIAKNIPVAIHLHDTRGLGLANALAAYEAGIRIFESAVAGIGGCPFAPGAAGNLATEDLVYLFHRMDLDTGIDLEKLIVIANDCDRLTTNKSLGRIRHVKEKFL